MTEFHDVHYRGCDGLELYARDYRHHTPDSAPAVLCLHGLTRNSADFEGLAGHLAPLYRVVCADQRGRGRSARDPRPANYQPATYVQDMFCLLDHLGLEQVAVIGTSMGGLMGMMMAALQPGRISALVLNDIGPEVDPAGLARIKSYVGRSAPVGNWEEAVAQTRAINADAFPDFDDARWASFAQALYREEAGVPVLDYDPAIAEPFGDDESAVPPDLWPLFEGLDMPVLVLRGEHSDILAAASARRMCNRGRRCHLVEIPRRGHAPTLDEPAARTAIGELLAAAL